MYLYIYMCRYTWGGPWRGQVQGRVPSAPFDLSLAPAPNRNQNMSECTSPIIGIYEPGNQNVPALQSGSTTSDPSPWPVSFRRLRTCSQNVFWNSCNALHCRNSRNILSAGSLCLACSHQTPACWKGSKSVGSYLRLADCCITHPKA